jgi:hypothetical protein
LQDVAVIEDFVVLEHDADMLAHEADLVVAQFAQVLVVEPHFAFAGFGNTGNQLEDSGLAGAGMAGDKYHFAFFDLEADVFQGFKTAGIGFGNLFETDHKVFLERGQDKLIHS